MGRDDGFRAIGAIFLPRPTRAAPILHSECRRESVHHSVACRHDHSVACRHDHSVACRRDHCAACRRGCFAVCRHDHAATCRHDHSVACRRDHSALCRHDRSAVCRHDRRMGVARDCLKKKEIAQRANPSSNVEFATESARRRVMGFARSALSSCRRQPAQHPSYIPPHAARRHDHSAACQHDHSATPSGRVPPAPGFPILKTIQRYL